MKHAPCYKCTRRSEICHAQCVAYHEWAAGLKAEREAARATADADAHAKDTIEINAKRANMKRRVGQR